MKRVMRHPDEISVLQLAAEMDVSPQTLRWWERTCRIPIARRIGNKRVWTRAEADKIKAMRIQE